MIETPASQNYFSPRRREQTWAVEHVAATVAYVTAPPRGGGRWLLK